MSRPDSDSAYRLDEIDRRIIYELMTDARSSSAPKIAEVVDVSPRTIRSRMEQLEDQGIITGYHAHIDFEHTTTENTQQTLPADFISLSGDSEIVELTVRTDAPITGMTISEAVERDVLNGDPLIIAIKREGEILTPHGDTRIHPADIVAVFSHGGVDDQTVNAFIYSSS